MPFKIRTHYVLALLFVFLLSAGTLRAEEQEKKSFDIKEMIFSHVLDSYDWHIITIGDKHITIPLFIIVKDESGWHTFSTKKLADGNEYNGFYYSKGEKYKGKVVKKNEAGEEVRPFDLSFTKNAASIILASILIIVIFLNLASKYKENSLRSIKGTGGAIEQLTMFIYDDIIKSSIPNDYQKFAPYLLTVFYFIFLNNLMGLIPLFPGGANVTGNIAVTLVLALFTFFITNIFGNKMYWKEIFWPDVPVFLKTPVFPLMQFIEFIGMLTKPFALTIRLFANMLAGHMIVLVLMGLIFIFYNLMGAGAAVGVSFVSILFAIFMILLDVLVAFIQAFVFTILSAIFIGMARPAPHAQKAD